MFFLLGPRRVPASCARAVQLCIRPPLWLRNGQLRRNLKEQRLLEAFAAKRALPPLFLKPRRLIVEHAARQSDVKACDVFLHQRNRQADSFSAVRASVGHLRHLAHPTLVLVGPERPRVLPSTDPRAMGAQGPFGHNWECLLYTL